MKINLFKLDIILARKEIPMCKLAKLSGISSSMLTKIKTGKQLARPITIGKIAKALDVDVLEIVDQED